MRNRQPFIATAAVLAFIAALADAAHAQKPAGDKQRTASTDAKSGDGSGVVIATGTIEPVQVVDVGVQVDGRVVSISADYGQNVKEGEILATIDDANQKGKFAEAQARLQVAEAQLALAKAKYEQAATNYKRSESLAKTAAVPQSDLESARSALDTTRVGIDVAAAGIALQKAVLAQAQIELDRTVIRAPASGTIIDRRVNVWQRVSSRSEGPSLFLIADLSKMEIWASVNEADIGRVKPGQAARFTVDAVPDKTFDAHVRQIRLNAALTQNVVTYTVVLALDKQDEKLLPYMTANIRFAGETKLPASP